MRKSNCWTRPARAAAFLLASTSILCLLSDFYGRCSMRAFALWVFLPSLVILGGWAVLDGWRGTGRFTRTVGHGALAGFLAALAYDVFRIPFVFARPLHLDGIIPALNLFAVFPRFGAMLLGRAPDDAVFTATTAAQVVGWAYHFSNGITFGVMYVALVGEPARRSWAWAVLMALAIELGMLATPYPGYFHLPVTTAFIAVTLAAHTIFGITLGRTCRRLDRSATAPCSPLTG